MKKELGISNRARVRLRVRVVISMLSLTSVIEKTNSDIEIIRVYIIASQSPFPQAGISLSL